MAEITRNQDFRDTSKSIMANKQVRFTCPYCGIHYEAKDPGFLPNCHNCGSILRKG